MNPLRLRPAGPRVLAALTLLVVASAAQAQRRNDFPSWKRDVDRSAPHPLPEGPEGRVELELSLALPGVATGLVVLPDDTLVVPLRSGRLLRMDLRGGVSADDGLPGPVAHPPARALDGSAVVLAGDSACRVDLYGMAWCRPLAAAPVEAPRVTPGLVHVALSDDRWVALDVESGEVRFEVALPGGLTAGPVTWGDRFIVGTGGGELVVADAGGGIVDRREVGEAVDELTRDRADLYLIAQGPTGRYAKDRGPFLARWQLRSGGLAPRSRWRLRVGGGSSTPPMVLDDRVLVASHDGYLRAVTGRKGRPSWEADLPARVLHPPVRRGGRLEFVLAPTGLMVVSSTRNGALLGWKGLSDEDEFFVGPAVELGGVTLAATSFGRIVGLSWTFQGPLSTPKESRRDRRR
ncbi:MAG: PQQ-binding-like beta-propeller repeat protein [Acidobacteriota bacterium]